MVQRHPNLPIIGRRADGRPIYLVAGAAPDDEQQPVALPDDLAELSDDDLAGLHVRAVAEFDDYYSAEEGPDASGLARVTELADMIEQLESEKGRREEEAEKAREEMEKQRRRVHGEADEDADGEPAGDGEADADASQQAEPGGDAGEVIEGEVVDEPAGEPALVASRGSTPVDRQRLEKGKRSLNQHLRDASRRAPDARVPARSGREPVLVAAGDIPDYRVGTRLPAMRDLAMAMRSRSRDLPVGRAGKNAQRYAVAYLDREHAYSLDEKSTPEQINEVLTAATNPEVLTAAGGWCAPPTTSYEFFNIVAEDGEIDMPTVGVPRGSMQWPVSPSFHDVLGLDDNPWTWTTADDEDALTVESVRKPCQRIDCPTLDDATLECDGICLTVGNLTDYAWPELVENHIRLLMAAQMHYMNNRKILGLVNQSTAVTPTSLGAGVAAPVLSALDLQAEDIRTRFRMARNSVIEAVLPEWIHGAVAADLALRQGRLDMELGREILADWLDARNIRAQFVSDWQIGAAGQLGQADAATAWPGSVQALVYPPGTFVLGQGMRLNLGVIRDSTLNETNDHTAAWAEDCWLVARIGHAASARLATIDICPNGNTHAGSDIVCA